jgi:hypothetical protein
MYVGSQKAEAVLIRVRSALPDRKFYDSEKHIPWSIKGRHEYPWSLLFWHRSFLGGSHLSIFLMCGMNLWDIKAGTWNENLLELTAGSSGVTGLKTKLGQVPKDGGIVWATTATL